MCEPRLKEIQRHSHVQSSHNIHFNWKSAMKNKNAVWSVCLINLCVLSQSIFNLYRSIYLNQSSDFNLYQSSINRKNNNTIVLAFLCVFHVQFQQFGSQRVRGLFWFWTFVAQGPGHIFRFLLQVGSCLTVIINVKSNLASSCVCCWYFEISHSLIKSVFNVWYTDFSPFME